ncbi:unnamed protein product [Nesidiocoris tenuis]|uniref:Uncharacterized protein n=1 Tax=Nesidiocoris tenuis TaxID=355587 RepID=A0A6H5HK43_9HEMI|nr:unnamed protein product [Nesidiocoris tenuis]
MDQRGNVQLGLKDHGVLIQSLDLDYDLNGAKKINPPLLSSEKAVALNDVGNAVGIKHLVDFRIVYIEDVDDSSPSVDDTVTIDDKTRTDHQQSISFRNGLMLRQLLTCNGVHGIHKLSMEYLRRSLSKLNMST